MYYKRLEQGRFHPRIFLRQGIGFRSMRWDELVLLIEGISPNTAKCISCMKCVTACPKGVRSIGMIMNFLATLGLKKVCATRKENELYI